jgi:hypothetical protein
VDTETEKEEGHGEGGGAVWRVSEKQVKVISELRDGAKHGLTGLIMEVRGANPNRGARLETSRTRFKLVSA